MVGPWIQLLRLNTKIVLITHESIDAPHNKKEKDYVADLSPLGVCSPAAELIKTRCCQCCFFLCCPVFQYIAIGFFFYCITQSSLTNPFVKIIKSSPSIISPSKSNMKRNIFTNVGLSLSPHQISHINTIFFSHYMSLNGHSHTPVIGHDGDENLLWVYVFIAFIDIPSLNRQHLPPSSPKMYQISVVRSLLNQDWLVYHVMLVIMYAFFGLSHQNNWRLKLKKRNQWLNNQCRRVSNVVGDFICCWWFVMYHLDCYNIFYLVYVWIITTTGAVKQ